MDRVNIIIPELSSGNTFFLVDTLRAIFCMLVLVHFEMEIDSRSTLPPYTTVLMNIRYHQIFEK